MRVTNRSFLFVLTTGAMLLVLLAGYVALLALQLSMDSKAEWWIRDVYVYKDYRASTLKGPKIIITSGSNSLFGINSAVLEENLGYPVANIAAHGNMEFDFYVHKLKRHLGPGDIIVLPLETGIYSRDKPSGWFINNMFAWGYADYVSQLDLLAYFKFFSATPKSQIAQRLLGGKKKRELPDKEHIIQQVEENVRAGRAGWNGRYSYESLDQYGEFRADSGPTSGLLEKVRKGRPYIRPDRAVSPYFLSQYHALLRLAEQRQARIIFTWPVSIKNDRYDLSLISHQQRATVFRNRLSEYGIDLRCNPALFQMDVRMFFNSFYHPNEEGAIIRSRNLADCLKPILANSDRPELSFTAALAKVDQQQKSTRSYQEFDFD
jgi:hypothetical protein